MKLSEQSTEANLIIEATRYSEHEPSMEQVGEASKIQSWGKQVEQARSTWVEQVNMEASLLLHTQKKLSHCGREGMTYCNNICSLCDLDRIWSSTKDRRW